MFARRLGSVTSRARVLALVASVMAGVFVLDAGVASAMPVNPDPQAVVASPGVSVPVTPVPYKPVKTATDSNTTFVPSPAKTRWPSPATGTLALTAPKIAHTGAAGAKSTAAGTPVWGQALASATGAYTGPTGVKVAVQSKALATELGISGVVWSLGATGSGHGNVRVGLDYSSFSEAIGGNYALRLRLVELPACALTTPQLAKCQVQTPLTSVNTPSTSSVSAVVGLGATSAAKAATASASTGAASIADGTYHPSTGASVVDAANANGGATVIGATDSTGQEGGEGGTYASDGLSSAGSWSQSGSSGDYTYTYKVTLPSSSSSLTPDAALSYDSGGANSKTSNTQAQSSWVGDGWETQDSYVQQNFIPCDDKPEGAAGLVTTTDECYDGQILTLSLNGSSTSIVDDAGTYKLQNDDGATVAQVTNAGNGTGLYNDSYWKITERDGTTYYFGRNTLPGWASGDAVTYSVDSERVYSAHSPSGTSYTDPCYNSTASSSYCTMAYKWHLDYVVNAKGEAMAYYYGQAHNYYAAYSGADNGSSSVQYVRDSYLAHIDYGFTTATGPYGTVPDKIVYATANRCVSTSTNCGTAETSSNESYYPDVPYDLICAAGATCTAQAPSFYSTIRLSSIRAEQYAVSSSTYVTVDYYGLAQTEPSTGDATSATLWLASITHTAEDTTAGSSITLPEKPVTFAGIGYENRVDTSTGWPGLTRFRLTSVTNETGGVIGIAYGLPVACSDAYVEAETSSTAYANTKSCFPIYWTPSTSTSGTPSMDWFNQWAVTQVLETDTTGGSLVKESDYSYAGAAWHYDDDETVKAQYRTYGQWRGYQSVTTLTGTASNDPQTKTVTLYYQGMNGDWLSSSSTRSVTLTDSQGGTHTDSGQLAGDVLESDTFLGNSSTLDHFTINSYWVSAATATRTRTNLPDLIANATGIGEAYSGQHLTDGNESAWRYAETDTSYDASATDANFALPERTYSHTVPVNSAYDRCTTTTYTAANTTLNIVGLVGQSETDSLACSGFTEASAPSQPAALNTLGAPSSMVYPTDVVKATETFYDGATSTSTAPTVGLATEKLTAISATSAGVFTWRTAAVVTYDTAAHFSRPLTSTDGLGHQTKTAYTLNSANLTTGITTTNALGQTSSVTLDPERNLTLTATDLNGIVTTFWYDALGRVIDEWDYSRATSTSANKTYTYTQSNTAVSGAVEETLNAEDGYVPTVTIIDSLGRPRQTQTATPQGGRLITDEVYNSLGNIDKKNNAYWDSSTTPTLALVTVADNNSASQDDYVYDGLGRVVYDHSEKDAVTISATVTVYSGDATTVIPPTGGAVKTTVTDPIGRTAEVEQYSTAPTLTKPSNTGTTPLYITGGTPIAITYGYDTHGNQYKTTDANSETWTSYYDLAGEVTEKVDPTGGASYTSYDADGNITQTKDANGAYVSYTYDAANRKTAEFAAASTAQVVFGATTGTPNETASWVYDNSNSAESSMTNPLGHLTTETSYSGGYAYVKQYIGFSVYGSSVGETYTIPDADTATANLAATYTVYHAYSGNTGLLNQDIYLAQGGLDYTTVSYGYTTALDLPTSLGDGYGMTQSVTYDAWSRPISAVIGSPDHGEATLVDIYDTHTGKLTEQAITRSATTPSSVDDTTYNHDLYGNITKKTETRLGSASDIETQCYQYDSLDRLTQAWSATDACAATPTSSSFSMVGNTLGNSSAYWTTWTYNNEGDRKTQDQHNLTSSSNDAITTYTYSTTQPHTLTATSTSVNGTVTASTGYTYDTAGNTKTRNTAAGNQTLTWNNNGTLAKDTNATKSTATNYVYDANGNLLIQKDPTTTTLYLPTQQLTATLGSGSVAIDRYYPLPGGGTAVRTGTGTNYSFEIADQQGTGTLALDYTCQTPTFRQFDPYGVARGTAVSWIDNRTLMGKPADTTTGLTNVGARYLDTAIGRFISLDPVFEGSDTLALGGYAYTSDNPINQDDPTGLKFDGGGCHGPTCNTTDQCPEYGPFPVGSPCGPTNYGTTGNGNSGTTSSTNNDSSTTTTSSSTSNSSTSHDTGCFGSWSNFVGCSEHVGSDVVNGAEAAAPYVAGALIVIGGVTRIVMSYGACAIVGAASLFSVEGATAVAGACAATVCGALVTAGAVGLACQAPICGDAPGGEPSSGCLGGESFTANTNVVMASGEQKPISSLKQGEKVEATNTKTGKNEAQTVEAVLVNHDTDLYDLKITTTNGATVIHTTAKHLYWDPSIHAWVQAANLRLGEHLLTTDGASATAAGGETPPNHVGWMWDLTISNDHDFYVVAGSTAVLVHNCGGLMPDPNGAHASTCECEGAGQNITYEQAAPSASQPASQFTGHALQRLARRGVSPEDAQSVLDSADPFSYYHEDQWKTGFYDPSSKIFIAKTIDGNINTVMTNVSQAYINRLQ